MTRIYENDENLPLPLQMQKEEDILRHSYWIFGLYIKLLGFSKKKKWVSSLSIYEIIDSERRGYWKI